MRLDRNNRVRPALPLFILISVPPTKEMKNEITISTETTGISLPFFFKLQNGDRRGRIDHTTGRTTNTAQRACRSLNPKEPVTSVF